MRRVQNPTLQATPELDFRICLSSIYSMYRPFFYTRARLSQPKTQNSEGQFARGHTGWQSIILAFDTLSSQRRLVHFDFDQHVDAQTDENIAKQMSAT